MGVARDATRASGFSVGNTVGSKIGITGISTRLGWKARVKVWVIGLLPGVGFPCLDLEWQQRRARK